MHPSAPPPLVPVGRGENWETRSRHPVRPRARAHSALWLAQGPQGRLTLWRRGSGVPQWAQRRREPQHIKLVLPPAGVVQNPPPGLAAEPELEDGIRKRNTLALLLRRAKEAEAGEGLQNYDPHPGPERDRGFTGRYRI